MSPNPSHRSLLVAATLIAAVTSCVNAPQNPDDLAEENARLKSEIEQLRAAQAELADPVTPKLEYGAIPSFTVGLAAAEQDFDANAFEALLRESLGGASDEVQVRLSKQNSAREVAKIRGMLVQQYLAAEEIPILISNLSYKVSDANHAFKIGGTVVPRGGSQLTSSGNEGAVFTHRESLQAVLRRNGRGSFSIDYEELGQGKSAVQVDLTDQDMIASANGTRAGRQGDVSFNWKLNLAKVQVYQVDGYRGDVGKFLRQMRLGRSRGELGQFQTLQDSVFLFGYGSYRTDIVSQLQTPSFIDSVEVASVDPSLVTSLDSQDEEGDLLAALGSISWQQCELADVRGRERVWRRPIAVGFPFVSRQRSTARGLSFYSLYSADGTRLLGSFPLQPQGESR